MAKFCAECGAKLSDDARFCGECGAPVETPAVPAQPPVEEIPQTPAEEMASAAPEEAASAAPEEPASAEAEEGAAPDLSAGGDTVEGAEAAYTMQEEPAPQWTAPQQEEPVQAAPQPPAPPREKKPLPKWAKPVGIAVVAVIVVVVALSLILKGMNDPEKVTDDFLMAMADGDFAALSKVAVAADEDLVLTEENTAPLFKLYSDSPSFRDSVEEMLEEDEDRIEDGYDPAEGNLFDLREEKKFLHSAYEVVIETCDTLDLSSNLVCDVTLDGGQTASLTSDSSAEAWSDEVVFGPDYNLIQYSTGAIYDLLPGSYTVTGTVETSTGTTFTAETTVEVSNAYNAYADLSFDYVSMEVSNYYDIPVEFYVDGNAYGSMDGEGYFEMGPLNPDQMIEARADVGADEPMTETFSASEGYWDLSFVLCEVEINNDYAMPMQVMKDGEVLLEVAPSDYETVSGLPSGTVLTLDLIEGVTEPVEYTCEDAYDYLYPEFVLTDSAVTDVQEFLNTYTNDALALLNARDTAGLEALAETQLRAELEAGLATMVENESGLAEGVTISITFSLPENIDFQSIEPASSWSTDLTDKSLIEVECYIPFQMDASYTLADGTSDSYTSSTGSYYDFILEYVDGTWTVLE